VYNIKISNGNLKIGKDTFILNITSATDCPTKKIGMCKIPHKCYALQPELRWTHKDRNVLDYRRQQTKIFDSLSAKEISKQIIRKAQGKRTSKIRYLRIHESGDFRTQEDVNKISQIANLLAKVGISVYGYTARSDLDYSKVSKNLTLNGSYFKIHNTFIPVHNYTKGAIKCKKNCRICNMCKRRSGIVIENLFH
jgi:Rps23 Pro-64 3,4-dihydroxylase Tpa1-like proline 4-hydroxylase